MEYPFDTARNITNAIYRGVFQRYPNLRLILAHAGGALPAQAARSVWGRPADAEIDAQRIAHVLAGLYYEIALAGSKNALLPVLKVTGVDHILFGPDWPIAPEPVVDLNIGQLLRYDGFTDEAWAGVDNTNASRLLHRHG